MKFSTILISLSALALSPLIFAKIDPPCIGMSDNDASANKWQLLVTQRISTTNHDERKQLYSTEKVNNIEVIFRSYYGYSANEPFITQQTEKVIHKKTLGNQHFKWEWKLKDDKVANFWFDSNTNSCTNRGSSVMHFKTGDITGVNIYHKR